MLEKKLLGMVIYRKMRNQETTLLCLCLYLVIAGERLYDEEQNTPFALLLGVCFFVKLDSPLSFSLSLSLV